MAEAIEFKKEAVNKVIQSMTDKPWHEVVGTLNKQGLRTKTGKEWSVGNLSLYAIQNKLSARRKSTARGEAGSTGGYSKLNGLALKRRSRTSKKQSVSDREVEEIMTSNLETGLKLKVIRLIAIGS